MNVTLSEDGKSVTISGSIPPDIAKAITKIARQRKLTFEQALALCLNTGAEAMAGVRPTDGQRRQK